MNFSEKNFHQKKFSHLTKLSAHNNNTILNITMLKHLTALDISYNSKITDLTCMKKLKSLMMTDCKNIQQGCITSCVIHAAL